MTDFDDYQEFTLTTAIYPRATTLESVTYLALGLNGEAGEVADKIKKIIRDNGGSLRGADFQAIVQELGDVLWYVARLADELSFDLSQVAQWNIDKLRSRQARDVLKGSGDNR